MQMRNRWAIVGVLLLAFACTNTGTYPVSGEDCAPEDPVQSLSDQQCVPT